MPSPKICVYPTQLTYQLKLRIQYAIPNTQHLWYFSLACSFLTKTPCQHYCHVSCSIKICNQVQSTCTDDDHHQSLIAANEVGVQYAIPKFKSQSFSLHKTHFWRAQWHLKTVSLLLSTCLLFICLLPPSHSHATSTTPTRYVYSPHHQFWHNGIMNCRRRSWTFAMEPKP